LTARDDRKRAAFEELWLAGRSPEEIAEELKMTRRAVATMASRLRREGVQLPYAASYRGLVQQTELRRRLQLALDGGERSGRGNRRRVQILELLVDGHTAEQVADRLGIGINLVSATLSDPDGSKRRKARHRRGCECVDCGDPVVNYFGRQQPRCLSCSGKAARPPDWDSDSIVEWIRAEARRRGRTPSLSQVKRGEGPFSVGTLQRVFGNRPWTKAVQTAGLVARPVGGLNAQEEERTTVTWQQRRGPLRLAHQPADA
jgi:DNA-binding CsgD family transcriptional regulator